jgi:hypothetical protein
MVFGKTLDVSCGATQLKHFHVLASGRFIKDFLKKPEPAKTTELNGIFF